MCEITSRSSWHDEQTAAVGLILTSSSGFAFTKKVPFGSRALFSLRVFIVEPRTFGPSGGPLGCNSKVPVVPLSTWQFTQFLRSAGYWVSLLAAKIEPLNPTTTNGFSRKPFELS